MSWTEREKYLVAALVVLVIIFIGYSVYHYRWMKKNCICSRPSKSGFSGDLSGWPSAGTFGNLADTNPYGNYADGQSMFWPTLDERNEYWTRS